ncbi:RNB domain-containing ribonuclease [Methanofollis aquaemaris]|uniref:RNB domain-containing ribonuclease n=1 Tax=Methanofollis aquaemaris TaxID=126734 RepID=A0A8A3S6H7_9EURY|nr:RNB domain-containing ribonuclease [Methanofollis aquaemaris]QSZ67244.1 RNB domain-containing ribonuclease [Methanofollis aquaemaris]
MNDNAPIDLKAIARGAMQSYGFYSGFSRAVEREVDIIEAPAAPEDVADLRSLLWSSIDNIDSMDLDQIEHCERTRRGGILVRVAIADVDAAVPRASATDRHAAHNGTAVYTGVETFSMLPERLSHGITSLLPGGPGRLAIVVEYTVRRDGSTRPGRIYRAVVSNRAKLVYEEVGDWLEGVGGPPATVSDLPGLKEQLLLQDEAARRLRRHRIEHGALDLETIEARAVMEEGTVTSLVVPRQNAARRLIEEFMIGANRAMTAFLDGAGVPMIQRVVLRPKNWEGIVKTAAEYGWRLPARPSAKALSKFLARQKKADPERFPDLSLTIVKLIGHGIYLPLGPGEPPYGHFGLAVTDYTHGTAPNRRYVDVIIQRLIKAALRGERCPYTRDELEDLAAWLTNREIASEKVERFMRKAAAAVLLQDRTGEVFDAIVTGASEKGTYVRLLDLPVEGRVMEGELGLFVGKKVRVRLIRTDPYSGYIDFERVWGRERSHLTRTPARTPYRSRSRGR